MLNSIEPSTPVIVGVGQYLHRDDEQPLDPIALIAQAARAAEHDAGVGGLLSRIAAIAVTPIVSWRYRDPGALVADQIGATPSLTMTCEVGGNTPQMLMNRACEKIAAGELDSVLLCGSEAYRTRMRARRNDQHLDWAKQDPSIEPGWTDGEKFEMAHEAELELGILMPTQAYPLFENALRHERGTSVDEHTAFLGELWAGFSAVAANNPYAWDRTPHTAAEISTVTATNRLIGSPYTKQMVSNPDVDMASAVVVMSAAAAQAAGIPTELWVFPHAGADGKDPFMSQRASFTTSPAMRHAGAAVLALANISIDEIAHVDVYSCFPSAVQIACKELGLPLDRQLTVYGGLCFAGGPWNNPVGHAIASMVTVLRGDPGSTGLVTANGGNLQKQSYGIYSTTPPAQGFRTARPQSLIETDPTVDVARGYEGPATIETWTVMHERDGLPARAHLAFRTPDQRRGWAVSSDAGIMATLLAEDVTGTTITVSSGSEFDLP